MVLKEEIPVPVPVHLKALHQHHQTLSTVHASTSLSPHLNFKIRMLCQLIRERRDLLSDQLVAVVGQGRIKRKNVYVML